MLQAQYLEHDLAQVCGRPSTWKRTWLKFVADPVLGKGLGSSLWQTQYLEEDLAQVGGRSNTWQINDLAPVVACAIMTTQPGLSK